MPLAVSNLCCFIVSSAQLTVPNFSTPMRTLAVAKAVTGLEARIAAVPRAARRNVPRREIIMMSPPETATNQARRSDRSILARESARPALDLEGWMFLRPFGDFAGRQDHTLEQRATALEIEMFVSAIARIGTQA